MGGHFVAALSAVVLAASAGAATQPVPVPAGATAAIKARAGMNAYLPTQMLRGFRYASWSFNGALQVRFRGGARREIAWTVVPLRGACTAGSEKTLRLAGKRVYWAHSSNSQEAWRCVRPGGGRALLLLASTSQPLVELSDVELGQIVASGSLF